MPNKAKNNRKEMQYSNTVVIMRGVSGSGKDTWIKKNINSARICSADEYFTMNNPRHEYEFDVAKLPRAHSYCMSNFLKALYDHVSTIVVNNTNIRCWEWENYALTALLYGYGYDVVVVELVCDTVDQIRHCQRRNVHQVPAASIAAKACEFESTATFCMVDLRARIKIITEQVEI